MEDLNRNDLLKDYQKIGLKIFPLASLAKQPLRGITNWWEKADHFNIDDFPENSNIGLALGKLLPDGNYLHALDIEIHELDKVMDLVKNRIPEAINVYQTTFKGGLHLFVKSEQSIKPIQIKNDRNQTIIELRGRGQYVVLAPSIVKIDGKIGSYKLSGNLQDIPFIESKKMQEIFGALKPANQTPKDVLTNNPLHVDSLDRLPTLDRISSALLKIFNVEYIYQKLNLRFKVVNDWLMTSCPFHPPDHNPSFGTNVKSGLSMDFHDGSQFNLIELIQIITAIKNIDFEEFVYDNFRVKKEVLRGYYTNKSMKDLLNIEYDKIIGYKKYLYEDSTKEIIEEMLTDSNNYLLVAPMGAGKSYGIIEAIKNINRNNEN